MDALKAALQYIEEDHSRNIDEYNALVSERSITYDLLWTLFPPNTLVYRLHPLAEHDQVLLARNGVYESCSLFKYLRSEGELDSDYFEIDCEFITDDGKSFGSAQEDIIILKFEGTRKIQDLPVYPVKYHGNANRLRETAIARGKQYAAMTDFTYAHSLVSLLMETAKVNGST